MMMAMEVKFVGDHYHSVPKCTHRCPCHYYCGCRSLTLANSLAVGGGKRQLTR